jgi:hypothetical protein
MPSRLTVIGSMAIILLGLASAPAQARQSQWWFVAAGGDRVLFVDEKSIERDGDIVRHSSSQIFVPDDEMLTRRAFMKTDCKKRTQQWIMVMRYDANDQPLDQNAFGYDEIQPVEPGTLGEAELDFVCAPDHTGSGGFPLAIDDVAFAHALIANDDSSSTPADIHARMKSDPATPVIRSSAPSPESFSSDQEQRKGQPIVPPRDYARGIELPSSLDYDADETGRIYDIAYQGIEEDELLFELRGYAISDLVRPGSGQTIRTPRNAKSEQIGDLFITILEATPEKLRYRIERKKADADPFPIANP